MLENKVALIMGGTAGIGRAAAIAPLSNWASQRMM
jgi:NAD(P)-dependent dehydrogenase (short-subunit alcohol dehydrogenase family)